MPFGRCECNPCEHDCAQPAKLREENARLRRLHEALLNTLGGVWRRAKSVYAENKKAQ